MCSIVGQTQDTEISRPQRTLDDEIAQNLADAEYRRRVFANFLDDLQGWETFMAFEVTVNHLKEIGWDSIATPCYWSGTSL